MAIYRVHRLKGHLRQPFRFVAHTSGAAELKPRDYSLAETVEAPTPYAAYFAMRGAEAPLEPGDVLESETGELRIFKFVGFEEARWAPPAEPKAEPASPSQPPQVAL
jgi:hypothetical protein